MLGDPAYGPACDMWSVGCILAELVLHQNLFTATNELGLLTELCDLLGAPTEKTWPGFRRLRGARDLAWSKCNPTDKLGDKFRAAAFTSYPHLSTHGLDLLRSLLRWDPKERLTAEQVRRKTVKKSTPTHTPRSTPRHSLTLTLTPLSST